MAGNANLVDQKQHGICIAIQTGFSQILDLSGCFPFAPELFTAAGEIADAACLQCFLKGFTRHPGNHQHFAGVMLLRNGGDQAGGIEFNGVQHGGKSRGGGGLIGHEEEDESGLKVDAGGWGGTRASASQTGGRGTRVCPPQSSFCVTALVLSKASPT